MEGKVVEGGNESLVEIADSGAIYGIKGFGKVTENGNDELDVGGGCDVKGVVGDEVHRGVGGFVVFHEVVGDGSAFFAAAAENVADDGDSVAQDSLGGVLFGFFGTEEDVNVSRPLPARGLAQAAVRLGNDGGAGVVLTGVASVEGGEGAGGGGECMHG